VNVVNIVNVVGANGGELGAADERRPDCGERWPLKSNGDNHCERQRRAKDTKFTKRTTVRLLESVQFVCEQCELSVKYPA